MAAAEGQASLQSQPETGTAWSWRRSSATLIAVRIDDKPGVGTTDRDPVQVRQRFMLGLGVWHEVKTG